MSMAFEDPCFVYVGASGAVFGFIGECAAAYYAATTPLAQPCEALQQRVLPAYVCQGWLAFAGRLPGTCASPGWSIILCGFGRQLLQ